MGGGEQYNYNLARDLTSKNVNVTVVTPVPTRNKDHFNFAVIRVNPHPILTLLETFSKIRDIKPDIVHISGPTPIDYAILPLLKLAKIHVIMTYHADFPSGIGKMFNSFLFLFQNFFDKILVQTNSDKQKLQRRGIRSLKLENFFFNGIDSNIYRIKDKRSSRDIDILFVGRMDKEHSYKGYFELLDILSYLKSDLASEPNVYVVGGGEKLKEFMERANEKGVTLNIFENIETSELISILNRSKTLVLPSISPAEGFGRVVLEAIYCGAVPIVSKYAGSSELITKYNCGIIIDPLNPKHSSVLVSRLLNDSNLLTKFQTTCFMLADKGEFDAHLSIDRTLSIYYEALSECK